MIKIAKNRHKRNIVLAFAALMLGIGMQFVAPSYASAQEQDPAPLPQNIRECTEADFTTPNPADPCKPAKIEPVKNPSAEKACQQGESCTVTRILGNNSIVQMYINPLIRTLTAIIGVVIVIAIVVSGIQYSSSRGDPSQVAAAKKRIMSVIIALLAYIFMAALLNWLIPGGLVST